MTLRRGTADNGSYVYTTTLSKGTHSYYFDFHYGSGQTARLPESGAYSGPDVEVGAAVLEVPTEYPTLANALAHARGDVIVQLAEGTFYETTPIDVPTAGIWIQGAGMDKTIIHGDGSGHVLEAHVDTLIRDLTLTGGGLDDYFESGLWTTSGHIEVRNCRITGNNVGLFTWCFSPDCNAVVTVTNSIFDHNTRVAIDANEHAVHHLINNTIVANGAGMYLNNPASRVENSLVIHNTGIGIAGGGNMPLAQYNDVWGNGLDYSGLDPGPGDLNVDPLFEDENAADYRLQVCSPCLDAGNPDSIYNDRNGGRNDMGAYGGPYAPTVVNSQASAPAMAEGAFLVSWQGYAADGIQNYDVQYQVGGDGAWQNWLTHTTTTSAWFGPDDPVTVTLGNVYCFRSRARDTVGTVEAYPNQADTCTEVAILNHVYLPAILREYP